MEANKISKRCLHYLAVIFITFLSTSCLYSQDTLLIEPGSKYIQGHKLKPHRLEFDDLLYRDTDSLLSEIRFYIQLTYGMKDGKPTYYMYYKGVTETNSNIDILRFDRETLAMQNRILGIKDEVAVLNFTQDSIYGNYPMHKDVFNTKVDRSEIKGGLSFDLNMNPYMYASMDLKVGMKFKWPAFSITTGKPRVYLSEVLRKFTLTNKYGRSYEVFDVVHRRDWNGRNLAVHHYVSPNYPYYIGRDWYIEPEDKKRYLWHRWVINDSELLNTTLEEEILNWENKN